MPTAAVGTKKGKTDRSGGQLDGEWWRKPGRPISRSTLVRCQRVGRKRQIQARTSPDDQERQERPAGQLGVIEPGVGQAERLDLFELERADRIALAHDHLALAETDRNRGHGQRRLLPGGIGQLRAVRRVRNENRRHELGDQAPLRGLQPAQDEAGQVGLRVGQVGIAQLGLLELAEQPASFVADGRPAGRDQRQEGGLGLVGQARDRVLEEGLSGGVTDGRRECRIRRSEGGVELDRGGLGAPRRPWPGCSRIGTARRRWPHRAPVE